MSEDQGTLEVIGRHLVLALAPLRDAVADLDSFRRFMYRLGWDVTTLPPAWTDLAATVDAAIDALDALGDEPEPAEILAVIERAGDVYRAVQALTEAPAGVDPGAFLVEIAERLGELLLVDYLAAVLPRVYFGLELLGVVRHEFHEATATRPAFTHTRLLLEELPRVVAEPQSIPARVYGWGTPDLDVTTLGGHLLELATAAGLAAWLAPVESALRAGLQPGPRDNVDKPIRLQLRVPLFEEEIGGVAVEAGLAVLELPAEGTALPGLAVQPYIPPEIGTEFDIDDHLRLVVRAGTDLASLLALMARPGDVSVRYPFAPGSELPSAGFSARVEYTPEGPAVLLGQPGRSRLELAGGSLGLALDIVKGDLEVRVDGSPVGLAVVVSAADLGGFLASLLGGVGLTLPVPLALAWSSKTGLSFTGGAGFAVSLYPHLELGPLTIERIDLQVVSTFGTAQPPGLLVEAGTTVTGRIGPVSFAAEGMGLRLTLGLEDGNAGPLGLDVAFKPPTGLGVAVDAGPVSGGGFISYEPAAGRYAGLLQLEIFSVTVTVIGLLDTRTPDGQLLPPPGFSFLLIVAVELPPIQLGFGFTLNGVGGLAGIHRTMVIEALQAGLRSGTVDHVLFPEDPVRNAPQIISDLRAIFPPKPGRYVFGPMAILGWGTPTLLEAELGIILELPEPIVLVLLGQVNAVLPTKKAGIVVLHFDVLGVLEFNKQRLSMDARLYDSYVAAFALSGEMALRLSWGEQPDFALSVGGLNPHFQPPPGFPALQRLTIALGQGENPRLSLQAYLAVTSNSLQFGARAELYAEAGGFNVTGWVGFDALVIFSPFSFRVDLSAGFALRRGTSRIAGIHVNATLTGPSPFHVWGRGCISILFFDVCVPFDATFGEEQRVELPSKDPWGELRDAIKDPRNWSANLPPGAVPGVSVRAAPGGDGLPLVHPMGSVTVLQRVVPLNRTLEKLGEFQLEGATRFDLHAVTVRDDPAVYQTTTDFFAPGQFEQLSDAEKLSRDSFERMDAGVTVGSQRLEHGPSVTAAVRYETRIVDSPWDSRGAPPYDLPLLHQLALGAKGAKALSPVAGSGSRKYAPGLGFPTGVGLADEEWVIASTDDLSVRGDLGGPTRKGDAYQRLKAHLAEHPGDRERLVVVAAHELETTP